MDKEERTAGQRLADAVTALGLAGVGVAFLRGALAIPSRTALWAWYDSPGLTPALLASALLLQALVLLTRSLGDRGGSGAGMPLGWLPRARSWGLPRVLLALVFCAVFVALMGRVPFGLLVGVWVFCMVLAFRGLDPVRGAAVAVGTATAVVLVFGRLLFVPLP